MASQVHGTWGAAKQVPGTATLNTGGFAHLLSVSCAPAGNCSAGGISDDSSGHRQAFVVGQVHGTWGTAKEVSGTATLNTGGSTWLPSLSCAPGNCSAGGSCKTGSDHLQAFVVNKP